MRVRTRVLTWCIYRQQNIRNIRNKYFRLLVVILFLPALKFCFEILACEITFSTRIGEGLIIHHGRNIILSSGVRIGNNVTLKHNITIGNKRKLDGGFGVPIIEDNCIIHPHVILFGDIILKEGTVIGAGSVVTKSTEKNGIYVGNPARRLK